MNFAHRGGDALYP